MIKNAKAGDVIQFKNPEQTGILIDSMLIYEKTSKDLNIPLNLKNLCLGSKGFLVDEFITLNKFSSTITKI